MPHTPRLNELLFATWKKAEFDDNVDKGKPVSLFAY